MKCGDGFYSRFGVAEKTTRGARRVDGRCETTVNERSSDRTHRSCENDGTVGVKTASRGRDSREARAVRSYNWDFTFNRYAGTLDPAYPNLLKAARQSTTAVMATAPHEQQSATLLYFLTTLTHKGARMIVKKAGNNGFEAYSQLCLVCGTSDFEGSTGLFV